MLVRWLAVRKCSKKEEPCTGSFFSREKGTHSDFGKIERRNLEIYIKEGEIIVTLVQ